MQIDSPVLTEQALIASGSNVRPPTISRTAGIGITAVTSPFPVVGTLGVTVASGTSVGGIAVAGTLVGGTTVGGIVGASVGTGLAVAATCSVAAGASTVATAV